MMQKGDGSGCVHGLYSFIHHLNFQEWYIFCEDSSSSLFTLVSAIPAKKEVKIKLEDGTCVKFEN